MLCREIVVLNILLWLMLREAWKPLASDSGAGTNGQGPSASYTSVSGSKVRSQA